MPATGGRVLITTCTNNKASAVQLAAIIKSHDEDTALIGTPTKRVNEAGHAHNTHPLHEMAVHVKRITAERIRVFQSAMLCVQ